MNADILAPLDLYFAKRVLKEEPASTEDQILFLAFLFALSRQGHLAFPLDNLEEIIKTLPTEGLAKFQFGSKSALFASPSTRQPYDEAKLIESVRLGAHTLPKSCAKIIKEKNGVFYLQKNALCEQQIAHHVFRILQSPPSDISTLFPQGSLNEQQKTALDNAAKHPLSLLFGGPGTGKTYTAAQLIQAFLASDEKRQRRVVVAAPTGKAASQLGCYIRRCSEDDRIRLGTCHALLGLKKERDWDKESPVLFADLILVDECSMIDAPLFLRLLASVLEGSRLVLIGDPDQLPSVEAGSIFADLVAFAQSGISLPFAQLKSSLRSDRKEIGDFAECIREGRSESAVDIAHSPSFPAVKWVDLDLKDSSQRTVYDSLWQSHKHRFPSFFEAEPKALDLMAHIDRFRLLSCMRQGSFGVDALNHFFAEQFFKNAKDNHWWALPLLIVRSDYALQLYNGDTGVLVKRISPSLSLNDAAQEDYALFPDRKHKDGYRKISALALPPFEWGYCLSVHKSQGSEYDDVFVLIPPGSEFFGREILYTAATRSKKSLACAGPLDTMEKVIQNSSRKISGLSARLKEMFYSEAET